MKKIITGIALFIAAIAISTAQVHDPVSWKFELEKTGEKEYNIKYTAEIDLGWHLYAADLGDGGPIPTSFNYTENADVEFIGDIQQLSEVEEKFDENFGMDLRMFSNEAVFVQKIKLLSEGTTLKGFVEFMSCNDETCLPPRESEFDFVLGEAGKVQEQANAETALEENVQIKEKSEKSEPESESLLGFFLLALAVGIGGALSPCVFPMIPMTVSFFMQGGKRSSSIIKGLVFGFSIIFIYTSIGLIIALTKSGAGVTNFLASNWIVNLAFALLFFTFAASFFGMFEIILPNSLASKADKQVDKGGIVAAFFMAVTFVIISFSCTGPFVASILVEALQGAVIKPVVGMFGFSFTLALPFTLLAIFPSLMKKMPKSGGWLNSVKVVFAFVLLSFGMKYLLPVDKAFGLNILTRDIYLAIWIVLYTLLGFYLLGKIKFSHDSDLPHLSFVRTIFAIVSFSFAVYMVPGLFGAELQGISSLLPSKTSQKFDLTKNTGAAYVMNDDVSSICETPKYSDFLHLPHGLEGYFDYEQGMACAKKQNKPVLLDFKGHFCSNCKKMESEVWSDAEVLKRLREDFIIIALYTDDNTKLPENEWVEVDGKTLKTIGKQNLHFQISKYNSNAQPYYIIVDHEGNDLVEPRGYDKDIKAFIDWMEEGKAKFKK